MPVFALADADLDVEDENAFWVAPGAVLIGRIVLKRNASVWFNAVLRGDNEPIVVGENSNIQDGAVLHTDLGSPLTIGADCTIGHMAMLHGCTLADHVLVGIKATLLNGARVGRYTLIGAHALITENKNFGEGLLLAGAPARVVRPLDDKGRAAIDRGAAVYVENWKRYAAGLKKSRLDREA
jgi:carbonic anhydrase/acetyltransferase-like protein (isoleucine patch superfamily)